MELKDLLKIDFEALFSSNKVTASLPELDAEIVAKVYALTAAAGLHLGTAAIQAALYQDDDAHDTCTLTACLNPLHPGPCKGWKGTLHEVSPGAWHALEAARVEKANHTRLKKIEALKSAGKPIPHKLLAPIVAKPHPNAGKTANAATGEAHAAGKAVSDAAGVHVNEPGKVTLGQAVKPIPQNTGEKGPKGKKPTVMSKGIAHVIAQEKVTPQYKLDKAAGITPEQWAGLSAEDKGTIRGELAKIQKDGFGPQQKKAAELLDKLPEQQAAVGETLKPGTPGTITTPSGKVYQKVTLKDAAPEEPKAAELKPGTPGTVTTPSGKVYQKVESKTPLAEAAAPKKFIGKKDNYGVVSKAKPGGEVTVSTSAGLPNNHYKITKDSMGWSLKHDGKLIRTSSTKEALEKYAHEHHDKNAPKTPSAPTPAKLGDAEPEAADDKLKAAEAKVAEAKAKLAEHQAKPKATSTYTPKDAVAKKNTAAQLGTPEAKPKPLPKHVEDAIAMANGQAPGATWSKNHLAAYQHLSADEFHALPKDVQGKVVAELAKGQSKFLDPKKIQASKDLLAKFGKGPATPSTPKAEIPKAAEKTVGFSTHLHDHSVTQAQAKEVAGKTHVSFHFLAAKHAAGLTSADNPDSSHHSTDALHKADEFVDSQTQQYDAKILHQPEVHAAVEHTGKALHDLKYAQSVNEAKTHAYNKISTTLANDNGKLSPIEKASLQHYQNHLLNHPVKTDTATMDKLQKDAAASIDDLHVKLQAAQKQANAPKPEDMSPAQIADRTEQLLGAPAASPKVGLTQGEMQNAKSAGQHSADLIAAKYPPGVVTDPSVAAKHAALADAQVQYLAANGSKNKLAAHLSTNHYTVLANGHINGQSLTAADKQVIEKHAENLKSDLNLDQVLASKKSQLVDAVVAFHAAAVKAESQASPVELHKLSDYDKGTIEDAYTNAWSKHASSAVLYGVKTYSQKQDMKAHPEYAPLTQDLGNLKVLAGKVALAHAAAHTAEVNAPTNPVTGVIEPGTPEAKAYAAALKNRDSLEAQFKTLHTSAQAKLDKIRTDVGLKKRALPKVDAAAVKATAAEGGYYKSASYGGPNYGKPSSAKQYMLAKVGPKLAVAHKTASEKKVEKLDKQAAKAGPMPAPKVHVKPPSSEVGKGPNPETAGNLGYHYTPKVANDPHGQGWPGTGSAYVSSPEQLASLQEHLAKPDTKFGLEAQKQFKWSIGNMEGKGAAHSGKSALYAYTGTSYDPINKKLNGLPPGAKSPGGQISSIDAAFASSPPLEGDVVLYRGFKNPNTVFSSGKWNDVNVAGVEWTQRSYSSTSGQLSTAQGFGYGGVVMRIIIPKEMNVHGINAKGGQHPGEAEIILQRGLRYRVVADHGKHSGTRYVDVMVVPSPYDKPE
jgi:hypothetical protein